MNFSPKPCAEFPNDNPELHDGAAWVCSWTRARPRALVSARGVARLMAEQRANVKLTGELNDAEEYVATPKPPATSLQEAIISATHEQVDEFGGVDSSAEEPLIEFTPALPEVELAEPGPRLEVTRAASSGASAESFEDSLARVLAPLALELSEAPPPVVATSHDPASEPEPEKPDTSEPQPGEPDTSENLRQPVQACDIATPDVATADAAPAEDALLSTSVHEAPTVSPEGDQAAEEQFRDANAAPLVEAPRREELPPQPSHDFDPFVAELQDLMAPLKSSAPRADAAAPAQTAAPVQAATPARDEAPTQVDLEAPCEEDVVLHAPNRESVLSVPCRLEDVESLRTSDFAADGANATSLTLKVPSLEELAAQVSPPPPRVSEVRPLAANLTTSQLPRDTEVSSQQAPTTIATAMSLLGSEAPPARTSSTPSFVVPRPEAVVTPITPEAAEVEPIDIDLTPEPPGLLGWHQLSSILQDFLLGQGATRAAAVIEPLLLGQHTDLSRLSTRVVERLLNHGIAELRGAKLFTNPAFQAQAVEFQDSYANGKGDAKAIFNWVCDLVHSLIASDASARAIEAKLQEVGLMDLLHKAA